MKKIEFEVKAADLLTAIKRVKHCMGDNEARRNLMGINLYVSEDNLSQLYITAADSFRIARQSINITTDKPFNIILSHYTIKERLIEKHLKPYEKTDKQIKLKIEENLLYLTDKPELFPVALKEEEYPIEGINRLLEGSQSKVNQIKVKDINSFYRASEYLYYSSADDRDVLKLSLSGIKKNEPTDQYTTYTKSLNLSTAFPRESTWFREVSFNIAAEDGKAKDHIGLNIRFLKEALKVCKQLKAEQVTLSYEHAEKPCLIIAYGNSNSLLETGVTFQQLILPVKLKYF